MIQKIGVLIGLIFFALTVLRYWGQFREWQIAREKKRKREIAKEAKRAAKAEVERANREVQANKRVGEADELVPCPRCGSFVPSGKCDCGR